MSEGGEYAGGEGRGETREVRCRKPIMANEVEPRPVMTRGGMEGRDRGEAANISGQVMLNPAIS